MSRLEDTLRRDAISSSSGYHLNTYIKSPPDLYIHIVGLYSEKVPKHCVSYLYLEKDTSIIFSAEIVFTA